MYRDACPFTGHDADQSLRLIRNTGLGKDAAIIDVGGGDSRLIDDLVAEAYGGLGAVAAEAGISSGSLYRTLSAKGDNGFQIDQVRCTRNDRLSK